MSLSSAYPALWGPPPGGDSFMYALVSFDVVTSGLEHDRYLFLL